MNITKDMTTAERIAVIREHAQKFNSKVKRNQRVRKTETRSIDRSFMDEKYDDNMNINHYTDASKYAKEYYGEVYNATVRYDNEWD